MTISASARERARAILTGLDYDSNDELVEYADDVLTSLDEAKDADYYDQPAQDCVPEIADQNVPVYTMDRLKLVSSAPALWTMKPELATGDQDVAEIAGLILYQLAEEIANAQIRAWEKDE